MSLIGYVTLEEANEYVETHFTLTDDLRISWSSISDDDKIVLLNRSYQAIELLPFTGRKLTPEQQSAFPRWPSRDVPAAIKWAQIENAIAKSDSSTEEDTKHYERLWVYGVESYSIGNLSEHTSAGSYGVHGAQSTGIVSAIADRLLRPFLGGGYRI